MLRRLAVIAAGLWETPEDGVEHIADSGNSVYLIRPHGTRSILRLTSPAYRSRAFNEAEMEYLQHLHRCGVRVGHPIPSREGALVEEVERGGITMLASAFTFAPGIRVEPGTIHWNERLFREWGAMLGRIHRASRSFAPAGESRRWHWREEGFIANAERLIPQEDRRSRDELHRVLERMEEFPVTDRNFGLTHADFAPQNFHYDPGAPPGSAITAFDFGNCCYHWYISDLAISISALRYLPREERDRYYHWITEGYQSEHELDTELLRELSWFLRLRILYVYLSRLTKFGPSPTPEEEATLRTLRGRVHEQFQW